MTHTLVLAPHTDDLEFGCGGTVSKLVEHGNRVSVIVFSTCEQSLPPPYTVANIKAEQLASCDLLGIDRKDVHFENFPVRHFDSYRQQILEALIKFKLANEITQVFTPSSTDVHQDHSVINRESIRAFRESCILGYELPWNDLSSNNRFFHILSKENVIKKQNAINCFESQKQRFYDSSALTALARVRGLQVKSEYAECFEVIRWLEK